MKRIKGNFIYKGITFMELVNIAVKSIFIENILLAYFLGMCSFLAVSKRIDTALGLGMAVVFVNGVTAPANWLINEYLLTDGALAWAGLASVNLSFLRFITYISVIAAMVQLIEMFIDKFSPRLYNSLGIFLPLIAVNCAILGTSLFMGTKGYNFIESTVFGVSSGIGVAFGYCGTCRYTNENSLFKHSLGIKRLRHYFYYYRSYGSGFYVFCRDYFIKIKLWI